MTNYPDDVTKTVKCRCGQMNDIPFQTTVYKCSSCGMTSVVLSFGTVIDKYGNYVNQTKGEDK